MKDIKQKLYCYVDESGQDTKGKFKWGKAEHTRRMDYLKQIFSNSCFKSKLRYTVYKEQVNYDMATIMGIAKAVHFREPKEYTTLVYVDGLTKTKRQEYGSELRDENNALTRLADSIAGFVRDVLGKESEDMEKVFKEAVENESLIEV